MNSYLLTASIIFNCFNFVSASGGDGSVVGIVVGIIAAVVFIIVVFLFVYCCYIKKRRLKDNHNADVPRSSFSSANQSVPYYNPNNYVSFSNQNQTPQTRNQAYHNTNRSNISHNNHLNNQMLPSQPPPYSAIVTDNQNNIQYTRTSGQPPVRESLGHDNPAFFNRSISSFAEFPSMMDILLTSSKTSLPAAVMLETNGAFQSNKFSDSARGDSIESKTSKVTTNAYDNPRYSHSPETNKRHNNIKIDNKDILNECFETYSDSDSDKVNFNPTSEKWLDPSRNKYFSNSKIPKEHYRPSKYGLQKNHSQELGHSNKTFSEHTNEESNNYENVKIKRKKSKEPMCEIVSTEDFQKKDRTSGRTKKSKKKSDSSDSGAEITIGEISMNPKGKEFDNLKNKIFENRHSKVSSDSGVEELSSITFSDSRSTKLKNGSKLKWVVVEENDIPSPMINKSLSTEV